MGMQELERGAARHVRHCLMQGHTVELEDPVLTPITAADSVPVAVHVTSQNRFGQRWHH